MKITYNAPLILTYTLICVIITTLDTTVFMGAQVGGLSQMFFMVYPFDHPMMNFYNPFAYLRLFSHALGHANWAHLIGNFTFILLIGPILEEKYGSRTLLVLMFITALVTGVLNASLFNSSLLGASGIVFMMILLVSFTNVRRGTIPLTFILVALLFLGQEIYRAVFVNNNVSEFAHIIGGVCGGIFGYSMGYRNAPEPKAKKAKKSKKSAAAEAETAPSSEGLDISDLTNID